MRLKVIACHTLTREIGFLGSSSPNTLDLTFLGRGGNHADITGSLLQGCIDKIDTEGYEAYDAIVLAIGADSCHGLTSRRFPLIVPRVHSCSALLLGSAQRERDISEAAGEEGIYWYIPGVLERHMPDGVFGEVLSRYAVPCGVQNARCLLGMERDWERHRGSAAYVELPDVSYPDFKARCKACASYLEWPLAVHEGDSALLRALLDGAWDERFLTVPPGATCLPSFHSDIVCLEK